mmetsp:Transcript_32071/g.96953  ORF Transcript_32071/g.96953 Transcript_32071/m.96953 type:complete len:234 (+) Transcript_32071:248-949(+)
MHPSSLLDDRERSEHRNKGVQEAVDEPRRQALFVAHFDCDRAHRLQALPHDIGCKGHVQELVGLGDEHHRQRVREHLLVRASLHDVDAAQVRQRHVERQLREADGQCAPQPVRARQAFQLPQAPAVVPERAAVGAAPHAGQPGDQALQPPAAADLLVLLPDHDSAGLRRVPRGGPVLHGQQRALAHLHSDLWSPGRVRRGPQEGQDREALPHVGHHPHLEQKDAPKLERKQLP